MESHRAPSVLQVMVDPPKAPSSGMSNIGHLALRQRRLLTFGILAGTVATVFLRLGAAPAYNGNEAREGVYVRAMLDTGDWILPQVPNHVENGEIIPDKPPLFHWISAGVASLRTALATHAIPTGSETSRRFDEWALRFPSAACAVLMAVGVAVLGRKILGDRAALLAAATLLASAQFVGQSQYGRVDMTMAAFVTLSLLFLGEALLEGSSRALLGSAVASGLAVLGKGPMGLVLPVIVAAIWIGIDGVHRRSLRWVLALPWGRAAVVWAVIVLPWYFAAYRHGGMAFVQSQLIYENFQQYTGGNGAEKWSFYIRPWLRTSFPWNILALLGVGLAWRARDRRGLFCATWYLGFLIFFEIAAYKRVSYLLPTIPAGAMMCGYLLDRRLPAFPDLGYRVALRQRVWVPALAAGILMAGLGAYAVSVPIVAGTIGATLSPVDGALCGLGIAVAVGTLQPLIHSIRARRWWHALAWLWLSEVGLLHGVVGTAFVARSARYSPKPLVARILADLPTDARVTVRGVGNDPSLPVLLYFPDPARIVVVPTTRFLPPSFAGYYLLGGQEWATIRSSPAGRLGTWRELWTDELGETRAPVIFVEHRS
jgi:4-amino-4-deoxy-L-arabinose transferase-like glycosyltransferase